MNKNEVILVNGPVAIAAQSKCVLFLFLTVLFNYLVYERKGVGASFSAQLVELLSLHSFVLLTISAPSIPKEKKTKNDERVSIRKIAKSTIWEWEDFQYKNTNNCGT